MEMFARDASLLGCSLSSFNVVHGLLRSLQGCNCVAKIGLQALQVLGSALPRKLDLIKALNLTNIDFGLLRLLKKSLLSLLQTEIILL